MKRQDFATDEEYLNNLNALAASTLEGLSEEEKRAITQRPEMMTECEREVIEKAVAFRKARLAGLINMPMGNPNDREFQDRAIALLTACDSAQLELERAVDRLIEEREKQ